jgi:hypothetical protein
MEASTGCTGAFTVPNWPPGAKAAGQDATGSLDALLLHGAASNSEPFEASLFTSLSGTSRLRPIEIVRIWFVFFS